MERIAGHIHKQPCLDAYGICEETLHQIPAISAEAARVKGLEERVRELESLNGELTGAKANLAFVEKECPRFPTVDGAAHCPEVGRLRDENTSLSELIAHVDDACVAVGVAVLDRFADGAGAVVVRRKGVGYVVADSGVEERPVCFGTEEVTAGSECPGCPHIGDCAEALGHALNDMEMDADDQSEGGGEW
jgi:hypothetical protein